MKFIYYLLRHYAEHRKVKRVIAALEIESARLALDRDNRQLVRYVDALKKYLEDA